MGCRAGVRARVGTCCSSSSGSVCKTASAWPHACSSPCSCSRPLSAAPSLARTSRVLQPSRCSKASSPLSRCSSSSFCSSSDSSVRMRACSALSFARTASRSAAASAPTATPSAATASHCAKSAAILASCPGGLRLSSGASAGAGTGFAIRSFRAPAVSSSGDRSVRPSPPASDRAVGCAAIACARSACAWARTSPGSSSHAPVTPFQTLPVGARPRGRVLSPPSTTTPPPSEGEAPPPIEGMAAPAASIRRVGEAWTVTGEAGA